MKFEKLSEKIEKNELLTNAEIESLTSTNTGIYIRYLQKQLLLREAALIAEQNLNKNLIRISKERKNQEKNNKTKSPGFQVMKITEIPNHTLHLSSGSIDIPCFKVKIETPYAPDAFPFLAVKNEFEKNREILHELLGKIEKTTPKELKIKLQTESNKQKIPNLYWDENWEADFTRNSWTLSLKILRAPLDAPVKIEM